MITASDLAQLGVCEQLIVFEQRYGKQRTADQQRAIHRGNAAHRAFHREALAAEPSVMTSDPPRCFIATAAFGAVSPETQLLRRYRDEIVASSAFGRAMIAGYYCASPAIARAIERSRPLRLIVRAMFVPVVWGVRRRLLGLDGRNSVRW